MSSCCDPGAYSDVFDAKQGRRDLKRYRRKGLRGLAKAVVDHLEADGVTVLEVGGGIGAIQSELLAKGASSAVNVELSKGYEEAAKELAAETAAGDRVRRVHGDFVEKADTLDPADLVVLNKVVCCYPDMEAMVSAASNKATTTLAMVFPRDRWFMRGLRRVIAIERRLRRSSFRFYIHDPEAIVATATANGLTPSYSERSTAWQAVILQRA